MNDERFEHDLKSVLRAADDALGWQFSYAVGAGIPSASPELPTSHEYRVPCAPALASAAPEGEAAAHGVHGGTVWPVHPFTKKVKLQTKAAVKGGCG